jgi:hypothetical protein
MSLPEMFGDNAIISEAPDTLYRDVAATRLSIKQK